MASAAARASLESLLRDKKLDRTLTPVGPGIQPRPADRLLASGIPVLDTALDGGLPRGQISEVVGAASSGRTALVYRWLAQATAGGELAAVVDVPDQFDPVAAAAQGVVLDRVLWVRGEAGAGVVRAIKALNLVASAGGFGLVVFDAGGVPARALRQLPFTTWLRVQRVIEGSDTSCVLLADAPLSRSPGGASIRLGADRPAAGTAPVPDFHAQVRANRYVAGERVAPLRRPAAAPADGRRVAAGRWRGAGPRARRLCGVSTTAEVQFALRTASCRLVADV